MIKNELLKLYWLRDNLKKIKLEILNNPSDWKNKLEQRRVAQECFDEKELEISKLKITRDNLLKEVSSSNTKIDKLQSYINQLTQKLDKNINKLSIPATPSSSWIKKSDEIAELQKKGKKITTEKEFKKIQDKISVLNKKMQKIWNGKKIEKVYEEILPIENKVFFITTFVHYDQSITEKVIFFHNFGNDNIQVLEQTKLFKNINEYKKDVVLINGNNENPNVSSSKIPIKEFMRNQIKRKEKPSTGEFMIWGLTTILTLGIPLILAILPFKWTRLVTDLKDKLIIGLGSAIIGLFAKTAASTFSTAIKKVDLWLFWITIFK